MDDTTQNDALIETYGNPDLPEGTPDRPLVTFALFAYNQEKFIREAVEGAFSQTYSPLEIILSDDCSSDRTFEIMREMAKGYSGAHSVRIRKNKINLGIVNHLAAVTSEARSEYIILAAGDDVSVEIRTEITVPIMISTRCDVACSNVNIMNEEGKIVRHNKCINADYMKKYALDPLDEVLVAPSAAYRVDFILEALGSIPNSRRALKLQTEDFLLWLYLIGRGGKIKRLDQIALVNYRINPKSLSSTQLMIGGIRDELIWLEKEAGMYKINFEKQVAAMEMLDNLHTQEKNLNVHELSRGMENGRFWTKLTSSSFLERLSAILECRSVFEFQAALVRLPGRGFAATLRWARVRIRNLVK